MQRISSQRVMYRFADYSECLYLTVNENVGYSLITVNLSSLAVNRGCGTLTDYSERLRLTWGAKELRTMAR